MAEKPGFFDYITAAFNARPFGMFVAPNWIGLGAFGLLGMMEPGFWVLGAGLELGYLLLLATNERFQRLVAAVPLVAATADWNKRIQALLGRLDAADRRTYDLLAQRCRSIIDLQLHGASPATVPAASKRRPTASGASRGCSCASWSRAARSGRSSATSGDVADLAPARDHPRAPAGRRGARPTSCAAVSAGNSTSSSSGCCSAPTPSASSPTSTPSSNASSSRSS